MQDAFTQELELENLELRQQLAEAEQEMEHAADIIDGLQQERQPEYIDVVQRLSDAERNESELRSELTAEKGMQTRLTQQIEFLHTERIEYQEELRFADEEKRWMQNRISRLEEGITRMNDEWHYWAQLAGANDVSGLFWDKDNSQRLLQTMTGVQPEAEEVVETVDRCVGDLSIDAEDMHIEQLREELAKSQLELENKDAKLQLLSSQVEEEEQKLETTHSAMTAETATSEQVKRLAEQEAEHLTQYASENDYLRQRNTFLEEENRQLLYRNRDLEKRLDDIAKCYDQLESHVEQEGVVSSPRKVEDLDSAVPRLNSEAPTDDANAGILPSNSDMEEDNSIVHQKHNLDISVSDLSRERIPEDGDSNCTPPMNHVTEVEPQAFIPSAPAREYKEKMKEFISAQPETREQANKVVVSVGQTVSDDNKTPDDERNVFHEPEEYNDDAKLPSDYERAMEYVPHTGYETSLSDMVEEVLAEQGPTEGFGGTEYDNI